MTVCVGGDAVGAEEHLPAVLLEGLPVELAAHGGGGGQCEGGEKEEDDEGYEEGGVLECEGSHVLAWRRADGDFFGEGKKATKGYILKSTYDLHGAPQSDAARVRFPHPKEDHAAPMPMLRSRHAKTDGLSTVRTVNSSLLIKVSSETVTQ